MNSIATEILDSTNNVNKSEADLFIVKVQDENAVWSTP